jgi:signal transduction histidine kinase
MEALVRDARLRRILRQVPHFLSGDVALEVKLDDMAATLGDLLGASAVEVAVVDQMTEPLVRHVHLDGTTAEHDVLLHDTAVRDRVLGNPDVLDLDGGAARVLGLSLVADDTVFGAVCVSRSDDREPFDPEDQALLSFFCQTIAPAVEHGVRLREAERSQRWMRASAELTAQVLSPDVEDPLALIADRALELANADGVTVMIARDEDRIEMRYINMPGAEHLSGSVQPRAGTVSDHVLRTGEPVLLADLGASDKQRFARLGDIVVGPTLAVPLHGAHEVLGVIVMVRRAGARTFSLSHMHTAEAFASTAALAIELTAAREAREQLRLLEERNRIARDLHDNVVQRLFATGLYLSQAAPDLTGKTRSQVDDAIVSIDQTIRQIRNTILVLRSTAADRLDQLFTGIVSETASLLGFAPQLSMDAAARRVTGPLAADLALSLREAMSNIVRHSKAGAVSLTVRVADGRVAVTVSDDGIGIQSDRRSGLENLDERARAHGGTFTVDSEIGEGTTLTWDMPLPPSL